MFACVFHVCVLLFAAAVCLWLTQPLHKEQVKSTCAHKKMTGDVTFQWRRSDAKVKMLFLWCPKSLVHLPKYFLWFIFCKIHTYLFQGSHFNLTLKIMTVTPHQQTNLFVDVSIPVDIIEVEGPLKLLSDRAPQQDGQSRHKVLVETHRRSFVGDWPHYLFPKKKKKKQQTSNFMEPECPESKALNRKCA